MGSPDLVNVLLDQHDEMRRLCDAVDSARRIDKGRLFAQLSQLVLRHERTDRRIVHPAARNSTPEGDRVGVACMVEEGNIERAVAALQVLGTGHATFDDRFAELRHAIADHTAHEERDEFPILRRQVTASRLHMMASEVRDTQIMGTT
jgi:hypothetical protein